MSNRVTPRGLERWLKEMAPHQFTYPKVTPLPAPVPRPTASSPAADGAGASR
jgi:hypothetical protein